MPIKSLKPITPGQRGRTVNGFDAITTNKPEKTLKMKDFKIFKLLIIKFV